VIAMGDLTDSATVQKRLQLDSSAEIVTDMDTFITEAEETIYAWFGKPLFVWDIRYNQDSTSQKYYFPERIKETSGVIRVFSVTDLGVEATLVEDTDYTLDMTSDSGQTITIDVSQSSKKVIVVGIPEIYAQLATLMTCWTVSDVIFKLNPDSVNKDQVEQIKETLERLWNLVNIKLNAVAPPSNNYFNRVQDSFGMTEPSTQRYYNNRYRWLHTTHS